MKLNKRHPTLPKWPGIFQPGNGSTFVVQAKHVSYRRFVTMQVIVPFIALAALVLPFVLFKNGDHAGIAFAVGMGLIFLLCIPYVPQIICRLLFPRETRIIFTPGRVQIGRKTYNLTPDVAVQFRAQRPAMSELKFKRLEQEALAKQEALHASYKLRFRRVEMIYGMAVIPITTVADETRAEQFAVALQEAFSMACRARSAPSVPAPARSAVVNEALLPE